MSSIELFDKQIEIHKSTTNDNKITKLNLTKGNNNRQVKFFIDLCPRMEYLEVHCNIKINLQLLVQFILMKYNPHLHSLCLCVSNADDVIVQLLKEMIDYEKLLDNYQIKRVLDRVYLVWE